VARTAERSSAAHLAYCYTNAGVYLLALHLSPPRWMAKLAAALAGCRQLGDRRGEGNALRNSAGEHEKVDEREKAIANAKAALIIRRQIVDPNGLEIESRLRARGIDP
jgi:hypothetical protein